MIKVNIFSFHSRHGFAILYAVLMTSVVLTVSLGLLNITLKQLILSSVVKESQAAYYTALSAFRCALRNDDPYFLDPNLAITNPFGQFDIDTLVFSKPSGSVSVTCGNGVSETVNSTNWVDSDPFITSFNITFPGEGLQPDRCATVTVTKYLSGPSSGPAAAGNTLYRALGYNTCDVTNQRRVERTISYETGI